MLVSPPTTEDTQEEQLSVKERLLQHHNVVGLGRLSVVLVPKFKPVTRKQFKEAMKYWPTHFHEDKRLVSSPDVHSCKYVWEQLTRFWY